MKPRTITAAREADFIVTRVNLGNYGNVRVDMSPRFFNHGKIAIISFWITYKGAKRLGINTL